MTDSWIIWESTPRWAAAIRLALARRANSREPSPRLFEVRGMKDVQQQLRASAACVLLVEVTENRLGEMLRWLSAAADDYPSLRIVGLQNVSAEHCAEMESALREAGVIDVTSSPRQLQSILGLALRHTQQFRAARIADQDQMPISTQVWNSLPWQED